MWPVLGSFLDYAVEGLGEPFTRCPPGFEMIVRRFTRNGKLIEFAVVLLYDRVDITRYDNEHDVPHRLVLGKKSALICKEWYENMTNWEAFHHAIHDFTENCQRYLEFFNASA
jgi:hypothetical protein